MCIYIVIEIYYDHATYLQKIKHRASLQTAAPI